MKGSYIDLDKLPARDSFFLDKSKQAGFRALEFYYPQRDEVVTRLDVKIGSNQYAVAFVSLTPKIDVGEHITAESDLISPANGVINSFNVKVAKSDIIAALEELLADIKNDECPASS